MSDEPPTPPAELPTDLVNTLNGYSPDQLQHVARYVGKLADNKACEARLEEEGDDAERLVGFEELVQTMDVLYLGGFAMAVGIGTLAAAVAGWQLTRTPPLTHLE